jgi:hypothetical protein
MPFLDEIADRIVSQGAGVIGQNLFLSTKASIPSGSGPYTTLIESGGTTSRRTHNGTATQRPSAQAVLVYEALGGDNGLHNTVLMGTFYQYIVPIQQINDLGLDELARPRLVFNINAEKVPS